MSVRLRRPGWPAVVAIAICAVTAVTLFAGHLRVKRRLQARAIGDTRALAELLAAEFRRQLSEVEQALRGVRLETPASELERQLQAVDGAFAAVVEVAARRPDGRLVRAAEESAERLLGDARSAPPGAALVSDLQPSAGAPFLVLETPSGDGWVLAARIEPDRLSEARLPPMPPFGSWAALHDRSGRMVWRIPRLALTFAQRLPGEAAALPDRPALRTTTGLDSRPRHESFVPLEGTGYVAVAGWREDERLADEDLQQRLGLFSATVLLCLIFAVAAGRLRARQRA